MKKGQMFRILGLGNILTFLNVPFSSPGGYFTFLVALAHGALSGNILF